MEDANIQLLIYLQENKGYYHYVSVLDFINKRFGKNPSFHPSGFLNFLKNEGLIDCRFTYQSQSGDLKTASAKITSKGSALILTFRRTRKESAYKIATLTISVIAVLSTSFFGYQTYISDTKNRELKEVIDRKNKRIKSDSISLIQYRNQTKIPSLSIPNKPNKTAKLSQTIKSQ